MRSRIDWASLIVGRKFTVFALFYFVFDGNFQVQTSPLPPPPPRGLYMEGLILRYALLTKRDVVTAGYWPISIHLDTFAQ